MGLNSISWERRHLALKLRKMQARRLHSQYPEMIVVPAFDTSIRDRALRQERKRLEKERCALLDVVEKTLKENREKYGIREAYITGSLLQPHRWYPFSDVDVAVGGCSQHTLSIMGELEDATEKEVDVIDLDRHPSPDWVRKRSAKVYG